MNFAALRLLHEFAGIKGSWPSPAEQIRKLGVLHSLTAAALIRGCHRKRLVVSAFYRTDECQLCLSPCSDFTFGTQVAMTALPAIRASACLPEPATRLAPAGAMLDGADGWQARGF